MAPDGISSDPDNWDPFKDCTSFEMADFLFRRNQMPATQINEFFDLWAVNREPPFANHDDLYSTIDSIPLGNVPWSSLTVKYDGDIPADEEEVPPWMDAEYEVWYQDPQSVFRCQLGNPDFKDEINYAAIQEFDSDGQQTWSDFMTGKWAWKQSVCVSLVVLAIITDWSPRTRLLRMNKPTEDFLS